ncbi:MAG: phospholipase D-like domain-containing protein [Actinomycetota bacterium]|nr:phospholipase D-like domain-containing protein [Actinomycetota bacterium]
MGEDRREEVRRFRRALEGLIGIHATDGNRVDVLRNGDRIFPAMFEAIRGATSTIDFLTFVYWVGDIGKEFAEALAERAEAGVRVRVILDALGAYDLDDEVIQIMEKAGVTVERFRPVQKLKFWESNHRTHRKVLICDENVAFTGGIGIADEWRGDARDRSEWRDTHFRVRGPAVCGLRAAFVQNWVETAHDPFDEGVDRFPEQPTDGPTPIQVLRGAAESGWSDMSTLFRILLLLARRRVRITTAYFVPDDLTSDLLCRAAQRGVEVEILVPGPHMDKRFVQVASESEFQPLLDAGVKLWAYQPSMLHAKVMTVDGVVANVGSSNFDARSLLLDDEVNLVIFDPQVTSELDAHFDHDLDRSEPIEVGQWAHRGPFQRAKEAATSLVDEHL